MRFLCSVLAVLALSVFSNANDTTPGHLLIIGGGLLPDNSAVYDRLIGYAAISGEPRFGIFPTAAAGTAGAEKFVKNLEFRGVPNAQIEIINVTIENAQEQTSNPVVLEQIQRCTGLIFIGGDQRRIIRALLNSNGTNTAALEAIIAVWRRGGVIAGTSAGAAVQADPMIRVSGLPEASPDQGMDALDFGRTTESN